MTIGDTMMEQPKPNGFEKHLQTGVALVGVGLIFWVGSSIVNIQTSVARLEVQVVAVGDKVAGLQPSIDHITSDLERRLTALDDQTRRSFTEMDRRVRAIETAPAAKR